MKEKKRLPLEMKRKKQGRAKKAEKNYLI